MRKNTPIKMIVYFPKTKEGQQELARRVAEVHADFVFSKIQKLDCPLEQKWELLDSVIDSSRNV